MYKHSYQEVFNVIRSDIEEYILRNGFPDNYCTIKSNHACDGLHFIDDSGEYEIYWLERGFKTSIGKFDN